MRTVVVVPTWNRHQLLVDALDSLDRLSPGADAVVVVDGNDDPVPLPGRLRAVRVVREPNQGPAHARNVGVAAALDDGADVVAFLDDDAVAEPDWLARHLRAHGDHPEAGMVGGTSTNLRPDSLVATYVHRTAFSTLRDDAGPVRFVPTMNASYKRRCLEEVGPFDVSFGLVAGEDVDHCARIQAAGWTIWFDPAIVVGHHFSTSWRGLVRQQVSYGRGFARTRHRHPQLPGSEFLGLPLWRVLAGTLPHVGREVSRTVRWMGWRGVAPAVVRELSHRYGAVSERQRLADG